jgi:hypothetical protein
LKLGLTSEGSLNSFLEFRSMPQLRGLRAFQCGNQAKGANEWRRLRADLDCGHQKPWGDQDPRQWYWHSARGEREDLQSDSSRLSLPGKGPGLGSPLVTTSSSSSMAGLLRSILSPVSSPKSRLFCRALPCSFENLTGAFHGSLNVRYWHLADISSCTAHVRYWG